MKKTTLIHGILLAAVLSFAAMISEPVLTWFFGYTLGSYLLIGVLSYSYIVHLLSRKKSKRGLMFYGVGSAFLLFFAVFLLSKTFYALFALMLIWVIRSLIRHPRLVPSLLDAMLTLFSAVGALWAYSFEYSVTSAVWSFFLIQALYVFIPPKLKRQREPELKTPREERFSQSHRAAEEALKRLAVRSM